MNFDAHCDIWTDITHHYLNGESDIFRTYHYDRLKKGQIQGGIFVMWNDPPFMKKPLERIREMMEAITREEPDCKDILKVARSREDMDEALREGKMFAFIGLEGLECIGEDLSLIDGFYEFGARHAGLTWNESNQLATGVKGPAGRGLTGAGRRAVRRIQDLGMLLDVSHLNDRSFWEVMDVSSGPVIASHSNCRALCNQARNLTDSQLKEIAATGGMVGLNSFNEFVHGEEEKQTVKELVHHLVHMVEVMGIDHVGFGFDFSEFLSRDTLSLYTNQKSTCTIGLEDASCVPVLVEEIKKAGFTDLELDKITWKNWYRLMKEIIK